MSASPSGFSNNQTPTPKGTNGGPSGFVRQSKPADPLRPRKKPVRRPNLPKGASVPKSKAPVAPARGQYPVNGLAAGPIGSRPAPPPVNGTHNGWTNPPESEPRYFPLYTTKRALREGLRYHVMRFSTNKDIDPTNQSGVNQEQFIRPVTLHRRDPKQPSRGEAGKEEEVPDVVMDSKEREKMEILKAEKDAKRAADLAQIAPSGNNAAAQAKKNHPFRMEKTTQVYRLDKTEEEKKASDLRYEEALPWHLEDAEGKQTWVGNYEAALSGTNVMFLIDGDRFLMVPIEKWYKFTAKNKFTSYTIDQAEAQMNKRQKENRWVMKDKEAAAKIAPPMHRMYAVKSESSTAKNANRAEMQDMDDLDFAENDLFQDDDEQAALEPDNDEEAKEVQAKIKRDQQAANIFDQANEAEVEKEALKEFMENEAKKKLEKGTRKALVKREKNYLMGNDDSDHPYSDSSEDDTSDEEKQNEIDKRKDEEAKNKLKVESKVPSGASSKGTNTPSGRPKHTDASKKNKNGLKRSGSPNLSESSGNESSRKKQKKHASSRPSGTSTPIPGSRPMSPTPTSQPVSGPPPKSNSATKPTSDAEATGGEMSDGGKRHKKIKLRLGGKGTPAGSRAGSPDVRAPGAESRAGSPQAPAPASTPTGPIQPNELIAELPPAGISMKELIVAFDGRIGEAPGRTKKAEFIALVKQHARLGDGKLLYRRAAAEG